MEDFRGALPSASLIVGAMDWNRYKARCHSPDVWSRWMLAQTLELVSADAGISGHLRRALAHSPLAKPLGHKGSAATDMFELHLNAAQADTVVAMVRRAVESGAETRDTRGRGLGGFLEAWLEYRRFVAADGCPREDGVAAGESACSPKS